MSDLSPYENWVGYCFDLNELNVREKFGLIQAELPAYLFEKDILFTWEEGIKNAIEEEDKVFEQIKNIYESNKRGVSNHE